MPTITKCRMRKMIRHTAVSCLLVVVVVIAFASKGGGDKKNNARQTAFTPIRSLSDFTLKSSSVYSGAYSFSRLKETNKLSVNTFMTIQKGNSIYIIPYKYKVNSASFSTETPRTNLQFIGVKIKIPK